MKCEFNSNISSKSNSNIDLKSNIITKDKWNDNHEKYLPFDLLPEIYKDPSLRLKLTAEQRKRSDEILFHCKKRREVKERIWETDKCYENCKDCTFHTICY